MSLFANDDSSCINSFIGERVYTNDSVLISYDDLRIVNSKLLELDYEKQINTKLRNIIHNDSIIIKDYQTLNNNLNRDCKKAIRQRNVALGVGILFFITSFILVVK